jgi:hypothetical protein
MGSLFPTPQSQSITRTFPEKPAISYNRHSALLIGSGVGAMRYRLVGRDATEKDEIDVRGMTEILRDTYTESLLAARDLLGEVAGRSVRPGERTRVLRSVGKALCEYADHIDDCNGGGRPLRAAGESLIHKADRVGDRAGFQRAMSEARDSLHGSALKVWRGLLWPGDPPDPPVRVFRQIESPERTPNDADAAIVNLIAGAGGRTNVVYAVMKRVVEDPDSTIDEKLESLHATAPAIMRLASAAALGKVLGATKQAIHKTDWWKANRYGRKAINSEKRLTRIKGRERDAVDEDG